MPDNDILRVHTERHGEAVVLRISGDLDMSTTAIVRQALQEIEDPFRLLVLDLSGLRFMDSSGLNLVLQEHRRASADRFAVVFAGLRNDILDLLRHAGVDTVLPLAPDVESALSR